MGVNPIVAIWYSRPSAVRHSAESMASICRTIRHWPLDWYASSLSSLLIVACLANNCSAYKTGGDKTVERAYVVRATPATDRLTALAHLNTCVMLGAILGPGKTIELSN